MGKGAEPTRVGVTVATTICLLLMPLTYTISLSPLDFLPNRCGHGGSEAHAVAVAVAVVADPEASSGSINDGGSREEEDSLTSLLGSLLQGNDRRELETTGFACKSDPENDVCVSNQPVQMKTDMGALTVYLSSPSNADQSLQLPHLQQQQMPRMVRPYVKKNDEQARLHVKEITILYNYTINTTTPPACDVTHDVPAVVFSTGLIGNTFHELNEIIIPIFLTSRHFRSRLQFVVTDYNHLWVNKFRRILSHLSDYEIINASEDTRVHCFPGVVTGLHFQNENLACKNSDLPVKCSIFEFRQFLREAFHLKIKNVDQLNKKRISSITKKKRKPVLVLLSRRHSRRFLNEGEMVKVATELGFRVVVATPDLTSNLDRISRVVNRCDVLVGSHGAGLTNGMFLPEGAVVVQMVPLGLQWASTHYFEIPAGEMGVQYLEYQISPQESSLWDAYGPNHPVITDPDSIFNKGFNVGKPIYIDGQDLRLDLSKFEDILMQALELLDR
ncbi:xylan glycosyltransferase MUCI21-like [Telopea speciosissima]|uniref:xylan glycosyltransferase MUCI21-like n=1 Tax=Telopea speciosissima TaxID=54955 RepID=UPI001CC4FDBD|nr:xylan glycosyltransferase MUCI21-like [Telopea speciosissima]